MIQRMKWIITFLSILIVTGVLYVYAMFQGGFVSWFLFFSVLPIAVYLLAHLSYPIKYWHIDRKMETKNIYAGDQLTVHLTIRRKIPFPIYFCIIEEILPPSLMKHHVSYVEANSQQEKDTKQMFHPSFKRTFTSTFTIENVPRGKHEWIGVRVRIFDLFGFFAKETVFHVKGELLVYPKPLPVQLHLNTLSKREGSKVIPFQKNQTQMVRGVREYVPGDRVSWIDWKQTAKQNKVMTREFEQTKDKSVWVMLDSRYGKNINRAAFETAMSLSLSIFKALNRQAIPVKFSISKDAKVYQTNEEKKLLYQLMVLQPENHPLNSGNDFLQNNHQTETKVMVTALLDQAFIKSIETAILHRMNITIMLVASMIREEDRIIIDKWMKVGITVQMFSPKDIQARPIGVRL